MSAVLTALRGAALVAVLAGAVIRPGWAATQLGPRDLRVVTAPAVAGAIFTLDGIEYRTDEAGEFTVPGVGSLADLEARLQYQRWEGDPRTHLSFSGLSQVGAAARTREVVAQFLESKELTFSFADLEGDDVPHRRVSRLLLKSSIGTEYTYETDEVREPQVLPSVRTIPSPTGRETKPIYYTVQQVIIDGTNVVNRSQQKFFPDDVDHLAIETQFFTLDVTASDAFFGFSSGHAVLVRWPDGEQTSHPVVGGRVDLPPLPRGDYEMRVDGPGLVTWRPVSVSSDQVVALELMSVYDIGALVLSGLSVAVGLVVVGRRRARSTEPPVRAGPELP